MDGSPAVFSANFANVQNEENGISPPLFYHDFISTPNNLILNALEFAKRSSNSDEVSDDPYSNQPWEKIKGMDKKYLHKLTERERRKQMRSLYSQLTSLLPQQNNKGNTSVTDQLCKATEYIRYLQGNIDLAKKRDELKMKEKQYSDRDNAVPSNEFETFRAVNIRQVGSLVVVTTNTLREQMALSELLLAAEEEGLQILNATFSTTDDKILHDLFCKVLDMETFQSSDILKQKIWHLMRKHYI